MYVGIDVGGTKTLIAVLNYDGVIEEKIKIPTNKDYSAFLDDLREARSQLKTREFAAGAIGIPVTLMDRRHDRAINFSNLPWRNVSITHDVERIFHCPFVAENDAKLAALSEAMLLKDKYSSVLYVTVSTGIGFGFVKDGKIDINVGDGGGRTLLLQHKDHATPWEDFASGRAIYAKYGKMAKDLNDESAWRVISRNLAKGFIQESKSLASALILFAPKKDSSLYLYINYRGLNAITIKN